MLEIYVHIIAAGILFMAALAASAYLFNHFNRHKVVWPGLIHGFFYTGLIGLGEFLEHIFRWDPFINTSLHYLHHLAAPVAMVFFYLGINEFYDRCSHPDDEVHTISNEVAMGMLAGILMIVFFMGSLAGTPWDERLEGPFLILILIPLIVITWLLIKTSKRIKKTMLAQYFPALGVSLSLLTVVIWLGRFSDLNKISTLYIVTHGLQDTLHIITATIIVMFTLSIRESMRENILFDCDVTVKSNRKEKKGRPKDINVYEQ